MWVIFWKDRKGITITNVFQKIIDESNDNPSKIWIDKGNEFCYRSIKLWLHHNELEIYSTHNER